MATQANDAKTAATRIPCDACGKPCCDHTEAEMLVCLPKLREENARLRREMEALKRRDMDAQATSEPLRTPDYAALRDKSGIMESLGRELDEAVQDARERAEAAKREQGPDPYLEGHATKISDQVGALVQDPNAQPYVPQKLSRFDALARERSASSLALRAVPHGMPAIVRRRRAGMTLDEAERFVVVLRDEAVRKRFTVDTNFAAHFNVFCEFQLPSLDGHRLGDEKCPRAHTFCSDSKPAHVYGTGDGTVVLAPGERARFEPCQKTRPEDLVWRRVAEQ